MNFSNRLLGRFCAILCVFTLSTSALADDNYGIFERLRQSDAGFDETVASIAAALDTSNLTLHGSHEIRVPDKAQQAHVFVLTSPTYRAMAANESPRTISAQVLRVAVYSWGENQETFINMANPVPHAMLFYAESDNYNALIAAAKSAANEIRKSVSSVSGEPLSELQKPLRSENHYRKYKGDGPARMMAKFRTFQKSQLLISESSGGTIASVSDAVSGRLNNSPPSDDPESDQWQQIVRIPFSDHAVYFGLSNAYIEDKMIRINSRFRSDGKSDAAPFPGVDHVAALPTGVLVINEDGKNKVLHYGQMWRMQLYFWDSGYRAFTANVGVPGSIVDSIEDLLAEVAK